MLFETISGNELINQAQQDFEATALAMFRYQYRHNELYRQYCDLLKINSEQINSIIDIPFLPISFFKSHKILSGNFTEIATVFDSSGTTGMKPSKHFVKDIGLYDSVSLSGFEQFYGDAKDWVVLALLPSYLERKTSSLVHMAQLLMQQGNHPENGFYLSEFALLFTKINELRQQNKKILLLGVTFALLDFAADFSADWAGVVVMETGGMKGRKAEWTRTQVHDFLEEKWNLKHIHSEYGMTELLSQAYSKGDGIFSPIATMKVMVRDIQDPLETKNEGIGGLTIIDLANVHSCAFIATEDIGKVATNGNFEVIGRMDFAALRGCSLLAI